MIDSSAFQGKKAIYYTLGCKLNFSETSTFGKMLADMGVVTAEKGERADICLINTCSVTEVADHKCRQAIHKMAREHPGAFVIVTGCYAQLETEKVSKIAGVDLVLGSNEKADLIQYLNDAPCVPCREDQGHQAFPAFMLERKPDKILLEGARRLQLLLHVLHDSLCTGPLPQSFYRFIGGSGRRSGR